MDKRNTRRILWIVGGIVLVVAIAAGVTLWLLGVFSPPRATARVKYQAGSNYLIVEFLDDDLVHFELSALGPGPAVDKALVTTPMVFKSDYPGPSRFSNDGRGTLATPEVKVQVNSATLCITVTDVAREPDLRLTTLCPQNLDKDFKTLTFTPESFSSIYGLGEKFPEEASPDGDWAGLNRYSGDFGNIQEGTSFGNVGDDQFPIAYFLGQGQDNYALFLDNAYKQVWSFDKAPWRAVMRGDWVRFYVLTGPDLPDLRKDFLELVGRPPVPPKKAFGLWVSEFGYDNWGELEDKLRTLRERKFPVDGFVLDLQWYGGIQEGSDDTRMGSLSWDETNFPNPKEKIAQLRDEQGVGIVVIEQSYVGKNLPEHATLAEKGYLAKTCATCEPVYLIQNPWWGKGGMIDWTNPEARAFWHDLKREPLIAAGVVGHWTDLGEPEAYSAKAWYTGIPGGEKPLQTHPDVHNLYNLLWAQGIFEGYARNQETQRPFILSRSGTAGIQRYGAAMWSGDINSTLTSLAAHLNVQMNMSLSGVDYYGADIGGFWRQGGDLTELYTQWFAVGTALDVPARAHTFNLCNCNETAPDRVGDVESNLANVRQRYELSPYLYSLAHRAYLYAEAVVPPLVYYYQTDPNVRTIGSEKLLGRDLLVATVSSAGQYDRSVYLPAGKWVDYHTGKWYTSTGQTFGPFPLYPDGLLQLPTFARAGAIVPQMYVDDRTMNIFGRRVDGSTRDELIVRVYADATPSEFTLYEDDGTTVAYQQGAVRTTLLSQEQAGDTATVKIAAASGTYAGAPARRDNVVRLYLDGLAASAVSLNGTTLAQYNSQAELDAAASGWYNAGAGLVVARSGALDVSTAKEFRFTLVTPIQPTPGPALPPLARYWPTAGWRSAVPEQAGVDSTRLAKAVAYLQRKSILLDRMLLVRQGYVVADVPFYRITSGASLERESATKAFLSTLVGIAIDQGYIHDVQQTVLSFFPGRTVANLDARKKAMTVADLLTMRSGLECSGVNTVMQMVESPDWVQFMLDRPMAAEPRTQLNYCDGNAHLLAAVLQQATGKSVLEFAEANLLGPLGIVDVEWAADPQGVNWGWYGLRMDAADTARLGYLYLNQGQWDGRQVVPAQWVAAALSPQVPAGDASLGYLWWSHALGYIAFSPNSQWLVVLPSLDMVVVLTGGLQNDDTATLRILTASFLVPAVQSAGGLPANPAGVVALQAAMEAADRRPQPQPVPPLPEAAQRISGKRFVLDTNDAHWDAFALTFPGGDEALLQLQQAGLAFTLSLGLDGVPRPSTDLAGQGLFLIAGTGAWEGGDTFVATLTQYQAGQGVVITLRMAFQDSAVELTLEVQGQSLSMPGRMEE